MWFVLVKNLSEWMNERMNELGEVNVCDSVIVW